MTTAGWETFWAIVIAASAAVFAILAVVVAIGGIREVRAMLRQITDQHDQES